MAESADQHQEPAADLDSETVVDVDLESTEELALEVGLGVLPEIQEVLLEKEAEQEAVRQKLFVACAAGSLESFRVLDVACHHDRFLNPKVVSVMANNHG